MRYVAIGDSISIDKHTGTGGEGAASRFARLFGASDFRNLALDGATSKAVLAQAREVVLGTDVVTVTAGGNDFLEALFWRGLGPEPAGVHDAIRIILDRLAQIYAVLSETGAVCIANTIYRPTRAGSDDFGAGPGDYEAFRKLNEGIRALAAKHGFLLADLEALFAGHTGQSNEPWLVCEVEPNPTEAAAIAEEWCQLYRSRVEPTRASS